MGILIAPKKDLKVPYPAKKRFLDPAGEEVERSPYWIRRIADGDVHLVEPKEEKVLKKKEGLKTESKASEKEAKKNLSEGEK